MRDKLNHPIFSIISEVCSELNQDTYVIGGFVRDIILKRPSVDIDIVTIGSGIKLAREVEVKVDWNFLFGFPGETSLHYEEMLQIIPLVVHLDPPGGFYKVRADRFSPYFNTPEAHGIRIKPNAAYSYIYDLPKESIQEIAYHFDIQNGQEVDLGNCMEEIERWINLSGKANCAMSRHGNRITIEDSRYGQISSYILEGKSANLYTLCHSAKTLAYLCGATGQTREDTEAMLDQMIDMKILLKEGGYYLSLATEMH